MSWEKILKFKLTKDADESEINEFVEDILNGRAFDRKLEGKKDKDGSSYNNTFTLEDLQKIADRLDYRIKWLKDYYAKDNDGGLE
jgi:hypothetical protein